MLKIGLDLDGVVIDSETTFRTYEELFDIEKGRNNLINREEPKFQQRYSWTEEEKNEFIQKYLMEIAESSNLMSGFKKVYELLKKEDVKFIVITARGGFNIKMKDNAENLLKDNGIIFDKYYWMQDDKLEACLKEKIDIMIDDDFRIIERISNNKIKTLYYRDTNLKKLKENEYIKEVNNWGDIYRYIKNILKED